jgi:hypothetical protein
LQPRNNLEGVVIERLAGDLWKVGRSDRSAGARISFRLRHEPVDRQIKDREEAVELGQHLLWQPASPLPVSLNEGEAKWAFAKFPLADVPGDPLHLARLLLKLEATVAGCDWLLGRWSDLRFRLAPENQEQGRQRLSAVVKQEEGRIGRIRAMLQKIADADEAKAPVRLAFETGTEGDRHRRYVLSYERPVNRRIDTFLKASGLGELDLVELEKMIGTDELADLLRASGSMADDEPGDLRSDDGRGRETLAQQHDGRDRETVAQQSDGGNAERCRPASADVDATEKAPSVSLF